MKNTKPRVLILSDMWGVEKSDWLHEYMQILSTDFEITLYDSCVLGKVNTTNNTENNLHQQFVNDGIDTAVKTLLHTETEKINILAFSIGGTIAWKAALKGLQVDNLFAVSATRLRYEAEIPHGTIHLYFGEQDPHKPSVYWHKELNIKPLIFKNKGHCLYSEMDCIHSICGDLKSAAFKRF